MLESSFDSELSLELLELSLLELLELLDELLEGVDSEIILSLVGGLMTSPPEFVDTVSLTVITTFIVIGLTEVMPSGSDKAISFVVVSVIPVTSTLTGKLLRLSKSFYLQ